MLQYPSVPAMIQNLWFRVYVGLSLVICFLLRWKWVWMLTLHTHCAQGSPWKPEKTHWPETPPLDGVQFPALYSSVPMCGRNKGLPENSQDCLSAGSGRPKAALALLASGRVPTETALQAHLQEPFQPCLGLVFPLTSKSLWWALAPLYVCPAGFSWCSCPFRMSPNPVGF